MLFNIFSKKKKQKIIIFGTGSAAIMYVKRIKKTHEIVCFMDNNTAKHGKKLNGISIFPPNEIVKFPNLAVIVASEFYDEIYAQLKENKNFHQTNIIYYRAMNSSKPALEKTKLLVIHLLQDLICNTPRPLIPIIRSILKRFSLNLVDIQSLDYALNHRELILRSEQEETVVGPNFINGIQNELRVTLPPVALYKFVDCYMSINSRGFAIANNIFIEKTHTISAKLAKYSKGHLIHHFQDKLALVRMEKKHSLPYGILINGYYDQNYYHWVIDIIPQLAYISELPEEYNNMPILISDMSIKIDSIKELLQFFDIDREINYLSHDHNYFVENLLIISSPNRCCPRIIGSARSLADYTYCRKESIDYIRNLVLKQFDSAKDIYAKKIFLAPSMKHRKYNQEEVFAPLQEFGFVKINPEKMTLIEQAKIFNYADIIVGPTGATWTNLVFAQHDAKALCWMAEEWGDFSAFSNLADIVGVKLDYLTYSAGVDDHVDLYSKEYVVNQHAILDWVKKLINN
jgi:capsular polysaccharide biosynthesis protein